MLWRSADDIPAFPKLATSSWNLAPHLPPGHSMEPGDTAERSWSLGSSHRGLTTQTPKKPRGGRMASAQSPAHQATATGAPQGATDTAGRACLAAGRGHLAHHCVTDRQLRNPKTHSGGGRGAEAKAAQHRGGTALGSSPSSAQRGRLSTRLCHQIPWTCNCSRREKLSLHFTSQHSCLKTNQSFQQPNRKEESCGLQGYRCTQAGGRGGGLVGTKVETSQQ